MSVEQHDRDWDSVPPDVKHSAPLAEITHMITHATYM